MRRPDAAHAIHGRGLRSWRDTRGRPLPDALPCEPLCDHDRVGPSVRRVRQLRLPSLHAVQHAGMLLVQAIAMDPSDQDWRPVLRARQLRCRHVRDKQRDVRHVRRDVRDV